MSYLIKQKPLSLNKIGVKSYVIGRKFSSDVDGIISSRLFSLTSFDENVKFLIFLLVLFSILLRLLFIYYIYLQICREELIFKFLRSLTFSLFFQNSKIIFGSSKYLVKIGLATQKRCLSPCMGLHLF